MGTYSITVDHGDSNPVAYYCLEISQQLGVDPVSSVVESSVYLIAARGGIVDIDSNGVLDLGCVEIVDPGLRWDVGAVLGSDVVGISAAYGAEVGARVSNCDC
jgi:hypothetical protein